MLLDYVKTIQITYNATRAQRLRYRGYFILTWKNPTNQGNMTIHEKFKDAVRQRAAMAHQGQGYTFIPPQENVLNSETSANNGVICASSSVEHQRCRHRHRQRHGGICNTGQVLNGGESGNKMSGKIKSGARSGEYSRSESSPSFCKILHTRSFFSQISPTDISECRARDGE